MGIADQICTIMINDGLSEEEATRRFWAVDRFESWLPRLQTGDGRYRLRVALTEGSPSAPWW
jgi:hypothetical protein